MGKTQEERELDRKKSIYSEQFQRIRSLKMNGNIQLKI